MALTGVPDVDVEILLNTDYGILLNIRQANSYLNALCQREDFWYRKVQRDLGSEVVRYKPPNKNYRQQYRYLIGVNDVHDPDDEVRYGRLDGVILLYKGWQVLPSVDGVNWAAAHGRLDILEWLEHRGVLPTIRGANLAARSGRASVLEWLAQRRIMPDVNGVNSATENGHILILEWLEKRELIPDIVGANWAACSGQVNVLEWLAQRGILPNEVGIKGAITKGNPEVLRWMRQLGLY